MKATHMSFEKPPRPTLPYDKNEADYVEHILDVIQWEKDRADRAEYALSSLISDLKCQANEMYEIAHKALKDSQ